MKRILQTKREPVLVQKEEKFSTEVLYEAGNIQDIDFSHLFQAI